MVAWMSGLVTGLQNRAQRFESASDLKMKVYQFNLMHLCFFVVTHQNVCAAFISK